MTDRLIIAVDFDGTCVRHAYPKMGKDIGAPRVLRALVEKGHRLILFTLRSGEHLDAAVEWFGDNDIPLFGVNENPEQRTWTTSPKPYANIYIDDAALGCPLVRPEKGRPWVDWDAVAQMLGVTDSDLENI